MSKHNVQSLSSHLSSAWSTIEKARSQSCTLDLAAQIIQSVEPLQPSSSSSSSPTVSAAVAAKLISMLASYPKLPPEQLLPVLAPFLDSEGLRDSSWPLSVAFTCFPLPLLQIHNPLLLNPFTDLMAQLSTLRLSPAVLSDDPAFFTPHELLSVGLLVGTHDTALDDSNELIDDELDITIRKFRPKKHYTPVPPTTSDHFDYRVILGLAEPLPTLAAPATSAPGASISHSTANISKLAAAPSARIASMVNTQSTGRSSRNGPHPNDTLITLGRNGPNSTLPQLTRTKLHLENINPQGSRSSLPPVDTRTAHNLQRRSAPRVNSSNMANEVIDLCDDDDDDNDDDINNKNNGTSPNQLSTDNEVQQIPGLSSKSLVDGDEQLKQKVSTYDPDTFRQKLYERRRAAHNKTVTVNETSWKRPLAQLPDTIHSKTTLLRQREEKRLARRKNAVEREEIRKKKMLERKKRRLEEIKEGKDVASEDDDYEEEEDANDDGENVVHDNDDIQPVGTNHRRDTRLRSNGPSASRSFDVDDGSNIDSDEIESASGRRGKMASASYSGSRVTRPNSTSRRRQNHVVDDDDDDGDGIEANPGRNFNQQGNVEKRRRVSQSPLRNNSSNYQGEQHQNQPQFRRHSSNYQGEQHQNQPQFRHHSSNYQGEQHQNQRQFRHHSSNYQGEQHQNHRQFRQNSRPDHMQSPSGLRSDSHLDHIQSPSGLRSDSFGREQPSPSNRFGGGQPSPSNRYGREQQSPRSNQTFMRNRQSSYQNNNFSNSNNYNNR